MRKEGEQLLEEKASRSPPTPEETREMARYLDVDCRAEVEARAYTRPLFGST